MSELKVGDKVNYHPWSCGPIASQGHEITRIQKEPNNFAR